MATKKIRTIYDHFIFGGADASGNVRQLFGNQALTNALLNWLSLSTGEILRDPSKGGYIISLLNKPMSDERAQDIKDSLRNGILQEFTPALTDVIIDVIPNYDAHNWTIIIKGYSPDVKDFVDLSLQVRNIA